MISFGLKIEATPSWLLRPFQKLGEDKVTLHKRRETFKKVMQQLTQRYEALKAQLNENETYAQVGAKMQL